MILKPPPLLAYKVVVSDCPWQFDTHSEAGQGKSASQHYDTMPTPDIMALLHELLEWTCDPNCVHLMWATWAMVARGDAHAVMAASGFKCISGGAWFKETKHGKDAFGNGYMFRDSCEPYLVGTRGEPGLPRKRDVRNGFRAKVDGHSTKPAYITRNLERMYPGPYLELFGRGPRDGWIVWGKEAAGRLPRTPKPAPCHALHA